MLQLGGVQEAAIVVPPGVVLVTAPLALTLATGGLLEVKVSGADTALPVVSNTDAVIVELVPLAAVMVVPPVPPTDRAIDSTGQVVKLNGTLMVFAMEAEICVTPGVLGLAVTKPFRTPFTL
jgi:hypothetical protein